MAEVVYLVKGCSGEHDDLCIWNVAAFLDRDKAEAFCKELNSWCKDNEVDERFNFAKYYGGLVESQKRLEQLIKLKHPIDPKYSYNCGTGVSYEVEEVPLNN